MGGSGASGGGPAGAIVLYDPGGGQQVVHVAVDAAAAFVGGGTGFDGVIAAVPKDGSAPIVLAADEEAVRGMAVDDTFVYWTGSPNDSAGFVKRVPKTGGAVETLVTSADRPWAVAIDGNNLYWTERPALSSLTGAVFSMPLSGAAEPVPLAVDQCDPAAIAVDATSVYWPNFNCVDGGVLEVAIGGGEVELVGFVNGASSIAVGASTVYWSYWPVAPLSRSPAAGGPVTDFGAPVGYGQGMAADASGLYIGTDGVIGLDGKMVRVDHGTDAATILAEGFTMPEIGFVNIGLDDTHVYFATGTQLLRAEKQGAP
jgi:hypothetical protein